MMDREPRKRKIMDDNYIEGQGSKEDKHRPVKAGGQEKDQEEDEEEKMEKFFALIRSTKAMRDRMRRSLASLYEVPTTTSRDQIQADHHQNKIEEEKGSSGMVRNPPSFQPEDFLVGSHHNLSGASKTEERHHDDDQGKKNGKDDGGCSGLDLNLSL